ncbi:hypothetical protein ACSSS7_002561 [Eimeria intestinalis]
MGLWLLTAPPFALSFSLHFPPHILAPSSQQLRCCPPPASSTRVAAERHAASSAGPAGLPLGAGQAPPAAAAAAAAAGGGGAVSSSSSSSRATPAAPTGGAGGGGGVTWAASPPSTAPLLGPQRNLLHAKKERICGGSLLPYWSARQIIINPLADDEAVTTSALGGRPRPHMQFRMSRFLRHAWSFWSRPLNFWLLLIYGLSVSAYETQSRRFGNVVLQVLLFLGAPLLLLLSLLAFVARALRADARRSAVQTTMAKSFKCHVLDGREPIFKIMSWGEVRAGNIVRVYEGEAVPAGLLILNCGPAESAILDLRMVDSAASFTRRFCVRETKSDYSLNALAGLRGRVIWEGPSCDSSHLNGTIRLDARPRGTPISAVNFAPKGSILRWTKWIDGVVLSELDEFLQRKPRNKYKTRGRALESACSVVVGVFALLLCLLCVVMYLVREPLDRSSSWKAASHHRSPHLPRCVLLLSCGPVALMLAVDILKLRRAENLSRRSPAALASSGQDTLPADCKQARPAQQQQQQHAEQQSGQPHREQRHQQEEQHERGVRAEDQQRGSLSDPPLYRESEAPSEEDCRCTEVYGQLLSPSALDDLALADFFLFDKATTVSGPELHLHGVCAGGVCFARQEALNEMQFERRQHEGIIFRGFCSVVSSQGTRSFNRLYSGGAVVGGDRSPPRTLLGTTSSDGDWEEALPIEDLSAVLHYYTTHCDERTRLEVLAQVASICHCASPMPSTRALDGDNDAAAQLEATRSHTDVEFQSTLPEDATTLALCSSLGYKPVVRRGTHLHVELSPISMPNCACRSPRASSSVLGSHAREGFVSRTPAACEDQRQQDYACSCSPSPLQRSVEALFNESLYAPSSPPVCLIEFVGSHAPSQRRPRLSCVVKPLGQRSGALLVVRGPAADVAKLCRGGSEALSGMPSESAFADSFHKAVGRASSGHATSFSGADSTPATSFDEKELGALKEAKRAAADAAHVQQVLLAAQQFSLEGWRPMLFAARKLSAEELALYMQLSEEASNSMHRHEERYEQVITSFETNLHLVGCVAMAERLQPGVRETLTAIREVGIRQVMLAGSDKHVALAAARRCGLLRSFDWRAATKFAVAEARPLRPLGARSRRNSDASACRSDTGSEKEKHVDLPQLQPQQSGASLCRRCSPESQGSAGPQVPWGAQRDSEEFQNSEEFHTIAWRPPPREALNGLVTNSPASLSHWAVADAQHLLQRCTIDLAYLARKDRRWLQRTPSPSMWTCDCNPPARSRTQRIRHRRVSPPLTEGRRLERLPQRSLERSKSCGRREKDFGLYRKRTLRKQGGVGNTFISMRHRGDGQTSAEEPVDLCALPLRRKLRVGRYFLRVFEDMWHQARDSGQGICLLTDATSLSFFLSHKLLHGLLVFAICRADVNVCAEIRGPLKQQLVACIRGVLRPRPVVVAAGSTMEDAQMLEEATVGILVLNSMMCSTPGARKTATTKISASNFVSKGTPSAQHDKDKRLLLSQQGAASAHENGKCCGALLPLLPENQPAADRWQLASVAGSMNSLRASCSSQVLTLNLGISEQAKQGPPVRTQLQLPQAVQQSQAGESPRRYSAQGPTEANLSEDGPLPFLQPACFCGSSGDVVLLSFESLRNLFFKTAVFEQAQSLLLVDQVIYSTSLWSVFVFALLLTDILDVDNPTAALYCTWFSLLSVAAACLVGRPMAAALDDERIQQFCYLWLRRRKILSRSRWLWSMLEGSSISAVIFAMVYQTVSSGTPVGALVHLSDFFLLALCVGFAFRPWLIALSIGGRTARARVVKRALKSLHHLVYRRAGAANEPYRQCSICGSSRRLSGILALAGGRVETPAQPSRHPAYRGSGIPHLRSCTAELGEQHVLQTRLPPTNQDTIASPYSSYESLQLADSPASPLSTARNAEEQHEAAEVVVTRVSRGLLECSLSRWKEIFVTAAGLILLFLPIVVIIVLPWLEIFFELFLFYGSNSVLFSFSFVPYAYPAWWLVLLPCVATTLLLTLLFRPFNLLLGPEKLLKAADDICYAARIVCASDKSVQRGLRHQQRRQSSFMRLMRSSQGGVADAYLWTRTFDQDWATDAFDVLALRELETDTGLCEAQDGRVQRQLLEYLRLGILPPANSIKLFSSRAPCYLHIQNRLLLLQRIAARLPKPLYFAFQNDEAVRLSFSTHHSARSGLSNSKAVRVGTAADSGDERAVTDMTTLFSEAVALEEDWASCSSFDGDDDFEASFSPAPPAGEEAASEQRATGALKGLTLTFCDPYLEAGYQSARQRELHRTILVFRVTVLVLLVLWLVFNFAILALHVGIGAPGRRSHFYLSFVPALPTITLSLCSFRHSFARRFELIVGSVSVLYIVLRSMVDYQLSADGMDTSLAVILVFAVMLRLPFKLATAVNLLFIFVSVARYLLTVWNQSFFCRFACKATPPRLYGPMPFEPCATGFALDRLGRCIPADSELHQLLQGLQTRQEMLAVAAAFEIGSTPEDVLKQREPRCLCTWQLFTYIPWVLGLVALMAFGGYRQEYNQRKRFLLDTQLVKIETVFETYLAAAGKAVVDRRPNEIAG